MKSGKLARHIKRLNLLPVLCDLFGRGFHVDITEGELGMEVFLKKTASNDWTAEQRVCFGIMDPKTPEADEFLSIVMLAAKEVERSIQEIEDGYYVTWEERINGSDVSS